MPQTRRRMLVWKGKRIAEGVRMSLSSEIYGQVGYASSHEKKAREKGIRAQVWRGFPCAVTEGL